MFADIGNSNFRAFMCLIDNELMEEEEEFSWEEERDELDEEYDRIQLSSQERMKSLDDKIKEAECLLENQQQEMNMAKELVSALLCFALKCFSRKIIFLRWPNYLKLVQLQF